MTFGRVRTVGLDVGDVIPDIDAARCEAERHERHERDTEVAGLVEHACCAGRSKDQHVLQVLLRAHRSKHRRDHAA